MDEAFSPYERRGSIHEGCIQGRPPYVMHMALLRALGVAPVGKAQLNAVDAAKLVFLPQSWVG